MVSILQPFRLILDPFNQERMTVRHERSTLRTADCQVRPCQNSVLPPAPLATNFSPHTALLNTLFFVSKYHIWALQIA